MIPSVHVFTVKLSFPSLSSPLRNKNWGNLTSSEGHVGWRVLLQPLGTIAGSGCSPGPAPCSTTGSTVPGTVLSSAPALTARGGGGYCQFLGKKLCMGLMTLVITVMIIANIYWVPGTVLSTLRILTHWILTPSWESPILLHAYDDVWQFLIKLNTYHLAQPSCSYLFTQGEWKFTFIPKHVHERLWQHYSY